MNVVWTVAFVGLTAAAALAVARIVRGPSLADRVVAVDFLLGTIVAGAAVAIAATGATEFFDVLVVVALLGFVASMTVARFIEERGA